MANKDFSVKNGIVVNTAFSANSSGVYFSNVLLANSSTVNATTFTGTSNNTNFVGSVSAANLVSNAQLSANLSSYQTTAGLSANVATLSSNNSSFLGGTAAASYQLNSTLSANVAKLTANNTTFVNNKTEGNLNVNSSVTFTSTTQNSQFNSIGIGTAASGTAGEIRATNDVTAYYSSDISLKEKITKIENPLEKLFKINGYKYDWKDDYINSRGGEDGYFIRKHDIGVIAQEIEQVLPEIVSEREDGIKAVKYERIVALLIEAVKELSEKVDILENRVK